MYKFVITTQLKPNTRNRLLEAASVVQAHTRKEPGCISYDFYTATDDENKLVLIECFKSKTEHEWHCEQDYVQAFIEIFEPLQETLTFELINTENS